MARSGGFAGVTLRAEVSEDELSPDEAADWGRLVEQLDATPSAGRGPARPGRPDSFEYDFAVRRGDRTHHVVLGEADLTPPARELANRLMQRLRRR